MASNGGSSPLTSTIAVENATKLLGYKAYGLTIHSTIPLREFAADDTEAGDVLITWAEGPDPAWAAQFHDGDSGMEVDGCQARFWFRGVASFAVLNGTNIDVTSQPGVEPKLLRLYLEGMMMAVILYQRGMCVLHASVIEAQGTAIAFLGHIGAGKSSTAAAFYARGHRILNDDNAAIQMCSGTPLVVPGFPYIKLFPAIASSLGFQIGDLRILHETQVKLAGPVHSGFSDRPLPLRTIYVLGRDHSKDMTRLSPLNATMQLIRNSVPTRWGQRGDSRHLEQCAALANQVPMFAVQTFEDLSQLPGVVDFLDRHQRAGSA